MNTPTVLFALFMVLVGLLAGWLLGARRTAALTVRLAVERHDAQSATARHNERVYELRNGAEGLRDEIDRMRAAFNEDFATVVRERDEVSAIAADQCDRAVTAEADYERLLAIHRSDLLAVPEAFRTPLAALEAALPEPTSMLSCAPAEPEPLSAALVLDTGQYRYADLYAGHSDLMIIDDPIVPSGRDKEPLYAIDSDGAPLQRYEELPGIWEHADLTGGETDQPDSTPKLERAYLVSAKDAVTGEPLPVAISPIKRTYPAKKTTNPRSKSNRKKRTRR